MISARRARLALFGALCLLVQAGCPPGQPIDVADVMSADVAKPDEQGVAVGTHVQFKQQPDDFVVLEDGDLLPIVLGHQGAWMVVLALRTVSAVTGPLEVVARIEAADTLLGELFLVDQELDPELDGRAYLYDIWLIVSDPSLSTYEALVTLDILDAEGQALSLTRTVTLSGGLD